MRLKRVFCFLIAALLFVPGWCAAEATPSKSFSMAGFDNSQYRDWTSKKFFARMEEKTGIHFELKQYTDEAAWGTAKAGMSAGRDDLPELRAAVLYGFCAVCKVPVRHDERVAKTGFRPGFRQG